ncbi:MAG TPA: class I SAM-dependent methyltransferase [Candidatus Baltobacteraceae bacterium]|nr:class I SAM-dependent methyltransferase [Candidatus Baltobacteraceae bacterium]
MAAGLSTPSSGIEDDALFALTLERLANHWATRGVVEKTREPGYDMPFAHRICRMMLEKVGGDLAAYGAAVDDFIALSEEFVVLQMELDRTGKYKYSSYEEVRAIVYDNPELMNRRYLNGLLLSETFWTNHYKMFRYFVDDFCGGNPAHGSVLEVPAGTGIFVSEFARRNPGWRAHAIDISDSSVAFSRAVAQLNGDARVDVRKRDVFDIPDDEKYDRLICGELLEHLERPEELLAKLARLSAPGARLFVTTAVWAANIDHIYLYSSAQEVRDQLAGYFTLESELVLNVREGRGPEEPRTPINYACILSPR